VISPAAAVVALALGAASAEPSTKPAATPQAAVASFDECVSTLGYFREGLKTKKASLEKEFGGKVPSAFLPLLNLKQSRIEKQQSACSRLQTRAEDAVTRMMDASKGLDSNSEAYRERKKAADAQRARLDKALARFASFN
jgi:hypothetical protein